MEHLLAYLRRFGDVSPQVECVLRQYTKISSLRSGEFFLQPGRVCHRVGFVQEGVFRVYVRNEEGKEITRGFPAERNFMIDVHSFYGQKASIEYWEAVTDIDFLYWDRADIERMEQEITTWQAVLLPMTQHILVSESHERTEMFNDDATTRYAKFLTRYPHIVSRVPLRHIACYLGIAPQSLSRIRQQMGRVSV